MVEYLINLYKLPVNVPHENNIMTKRFLLALAFCLTLGAEEATFVSKLADINSNSFPWEDTSWSSFSYRDFLEMHMKENGQNFKISQKIAWIS